MIYTLTLNPSIDYYITTDSFVLGATNRSQDQRFAVGGKGLNVSKMLSRFQVKNVALGFVGGFTGAEIKAIAGADFTCDFIEVDNPSRVNVKLNVGAKETDINGGGPDVTEQDLLDLQEKLDLINSEDILLLSGSLLPNLPQDFYTNIAISSKSKCIIADVFGPALEDILKAKPFLVKPNSDEISELFGVKINTRPLALSYARKMREMGARNVLVSLGGQGAVFLAESGGEFAINAHAGEVVNTVGAGDTMLAAFIARLFPDSVFTDKLRFSSALEFSVAAGSAAAFCGEFPTNEDILKVMRKKP